MNYNDQTPRGEITVKGVILTAVKPYAEGHTLTANEAAVLNQTLAENLRNNFATTVAKAVEEAGSVEAVDVAALQAAFNDYQNTYEFGVRKSGGTRTPTDPVAKEALKIAKEIVRKALKDKNYKLSEVPAEKINELAEGLIESNPKIREAAAKRVAEAQAIAGESINLDDLAA